MDYTTRCGNTPRAYSAAASLPKRIPQPELTKPAYDGKYALEERNKSLPSSRTRNSTIITNLLLRQVRLNGNRVDIVERCLQWFRGTTMHLISIMNADVDNLPTGLHVPHFEHLTDFAPDEMCLYFSVRALMLDLILDLLRSLRDDNELMNLRKEIERLKKERKDLLEENMDLGQSLYAYERKNATMQREQQQLMSDIDALLQKCNDEYIKKLDRQELYQAKEDGWAKNFELQMRITDLERVLDLYKQELHKTKMDSNNELNKRNRSYSRQVEKDLNNVKGQLNTVQEKNDALQKSNKEIEMKLVESQQELEKTKSELYKAKEELNILQNELKNECEETKQVKELLARMQKETRTENKRLNNALEETKQVKESLARVQNETRTENESNSNLRQEADRYKQENNIVKEELRKTVETITSAQERIDHLERELRDEQRQLANAKLELQQSLGNNDDLKNNMLKLRKVAERYKQERDSVKEELQKAKEETTSFLKCNSKFRQEVDQYKQERDRVTKELRTTEETLSSAQERIERLERNVEDEQRQSANAKSELQHTIGINEDLQTKLTNAQNNISQLKDSLSRFQKDTRTEDGSRSTLRGEAEPYKQERDYLKEELQKAKEKTNSSRERIAQLEQKLEEQHRQLANVKSELYQTQEKNEDLQNRFSQDTAAQLTHANPSIAELSDVNRPTKLAERFFELYDNEWTDAFTAIEDDPRNVASEEDIAKKLKDILRNCFQKCVDISNQQLANIEATLFNPGSGKHTSSSRQLTPKQAMTITDLRRETSIFSTEHIKQEMCRRFHDSTKLKDLKLFIEKCSELCWLMAVQSPPVVIEDRHRPGDRFDGDVFKAYTKSGKVIECVVWPSVYLHKGGPLLCKGIAQGKE